MNIQFDISVSEGYKSQSQIARVLTENWVKSNIYCPSCGNEYLNDFANNFPVADFYYQGCSSQYELKSKKGSFSLRIIKDNWKLLGDAYTPLDLKQGNKDAKLSWFVKFNTIRNRVMHPERKDVAEEEYTLVKNVKKMAS